MNTEELKSLAGKACIDIFKDFDAFEILKMSCSIREAWKIGRDLEAAQ